MVNLVVLDNQTHRRLRVATTRVGGYAALNAVSVITREFSRLLARYPIFFTKSADTGQFEPAALLGFARGAADYLDVYAARRATATWRARRGGHASGSSARSRTAGELLV